MQIAFADLAGTFSDQKSTFKIGCFVDTNILFAAALPLDRLNEWSEKVFDQIHSLELPIFTNINVRSEFIDQMRRVLIPEGLVSLYDELKGSLDPQLEQQLKSLKTQKDQVAREDKLFKFNDQQIKKYRDLLQGFPASSSPDLNAWDLFCHDYFQDYIADIWEDTVRELGIQFVGSRSIESKVHFDRDPEWKDMVQIIGQSGIGSSDAMILNLFFCSRFPLIITADEDVAYTVEKLGPTDKYVLAP